MFSVRSNDPRLGQTCGVVNQSGRKRRSQQKEPRHQDNSDDGRNKRLEGIIVSDIRGKCRFLEASDFTQSMLFIAQSPPSASDPHIRNLVSPFLRQARINNQIPSKTRAGDTSMVRPYPYLLAYLQLCQLIL